MNGKHKRMFWGMILLVDAIVIGIMLFSFCAKNDYSRNQKRNSHLIGMSYMTMNNEFYKIVSEEISARVEAEGDRVVLRDPALDADRQIEQIREMMDQGIDVLVVTPVDLESLSDVLGQAKEQGIRIIVVDTNLSDDTLADCTITSDNYDAGVIVGRYFLTQCEGAKLLVMTHTTTRSGQDRVQGFLDTVNGKEGIEIVAQIECEGQLEIAMPKLQEAINAGVSFDNIFCLNDLAAVGVVAALEENQMLDNVGVYGVDGSPDAKALIEEGLMDATAAQFPTEIGSRAADAIYRLLDGKSVEKNILVPVKLVTRQNVEEFGIDRWQ